MLLQELWACLYPEEELVPGSDQWQRIGFQGKDPSTDFRGTGVLGLKHLLYCARAFPNEYKDICKLSSRGLYRLGAQSFSLLLTMKVKIKSKLWSRLFQLVIRWRRSA